MFFTLRVTAELPKGFIPWSVAKGLLLMVREIGENGAPHYHTIFEGTMNAIRCYCKRNIPGGNASWSCKLLDDVEGFKRYCCKGVDVDTLPEVIYNIGIDVSEYHQAYWKVNAELKAAVKKKKPENVLEQIWGDLQESIGGSTDGVTIASLILRWHIDRSKRVPNSFNMCSMVQTFICRSNERLEGVDKMSDIELVRRLYPNINY